MDPLEFLPGALPGTVFDGRSVSTYMERLRGDYHSNVDEVMLGYADKKPIANMKCSETVVCKAPSPTLSMNQVDECISIDETDAPAELDDDLLHLYDDSNEDDTFEYCEVRPFSVDQEGT